MFGNFQSLAEGNERFTATFALPVDTPGSTLISRRPFAQLATSELDDPPACRYDETDAIAYCDNVLVPWGRAFTYNRVDMPRAAFADAPAHLLGNVQTHIRLLVKLHVFILGVMKRVADANGILTVPDLVGTEFANRHTQHEIFYGGAPRCRSEPHMALFPMGGCQCASRPITQEHRNYDDLVVGRKRDDAGGGRRIALAATA